MNNITFILYRFNTFKRWVQLYLCLGKRLIPEQCNCYYRNAWTVKEYYSLFIDMGHSLWGITIMPLHKRLQQRLKHLWTKRSFYFYVGLYFRSFMKGNLRSSHVDSFSRSCFFLQDLRRRSIVPTIHLILKRFFYVILIDLIDLKRFYLILMDSSRPNKHIYPTLE
jgi:hypothetical protein